MSKLAGNSRAALLGVLFAVVGFSYAIASYDAGSVGGPSVGSRGVGTNPLQFTNALHSSGDRDLGDIVAGSGFIRWIRATGGVQPYKFTSTNTPTLQSVLPLATLLLKGELIGSTAASFNTNPVRFRVTVEDSGNSNGTGGAFVTEFFRLTLITGNTFRFATDTLPSTVQYVDYVSRVEVLNGAAPYRYTVVPGSITLDGTTLLSLEAAGLELSESDGTVFGKPIVAGTLTFTVRATDSANTVALGRSPATTTDQVFSIDIAANNTAQSNIIATSIQIKGDTANPGKDSIKYSGLANLAGINISSLAGDDLTLRVADYVTPDTAATPATLDDKGKTIKPTVKDKNAPTVKGAVSSKGSVKISVGKENFGNLGLLGDLSGQPRLIAVSVQVGDALIGTEILRFDIKTSGTKFQLTYKLGNNIPVAGGFIITAVQGKDDVKNRLGETWKASFVALPIARTAGNSGNLTFGSFGGSRSAVVSIGANFSDVVGVSESKGKVKSTDKTKAANQVSKLQMDEKRGKGAIQTTVVDNALSGLREANNLPEGTELNFTLNVTLTDAANGGGNTIYAGEGSSSIYAKKTSWSSKNPNK